MPVWFEQREYGFGAGLPVAPEGWALLGGYAVALTALSATLLPGKPLQFLAGKTIITAALVIAVEKTARGGFRWRWGGKP